MSKIKVTTEYPRTRGVPQCSKVGHTFVLLGSASYVDKSFTKGTKVKYLGLRSPHSNIAHPMGVFSFPDGTERCLCDFEYETIDSEYCRMSKEAKVLCRYCRHLDGMRCLQKADIYTACDYALCDSFRTKESYQVFARTAVVFPGDRVIEDMQIIADELNRLRYAIEDCLDKNRHLADGDDCTLIDLKRALKAKDTDGWYTDRPLLFDRTKFPFPKVDGPHFTVNDLRELRKKRYVGNQEDPYTIPERRTSEETREEECDAR